MLAADVAQKLALLLGQILRPSRVAPSLGAQRRHSPFLIGVVPALQRRDGVLSRAVRLRRPVALRRQRHQRLAQLPVVELPSGQGPNDFAAEYRDLLRAVLGRECVQVGHLGPFRHRMSAGHRLNA